MSSRVLGPEFGGAIGLLFYVANVVSSALYLSGCVEGLMTNFGPKGTMGHFLPDGTGLPLVYASTINMINLVICIFGAAMFAKATLIIFSVVASIALIVIASLLFQPATSDIPIPDKNFIFNNTVNGTIVWSQVPFTGLNWTTFTSNLYSNYTYDYTSEDKQPKVTDFAEIFGVFFTGVTGVLAGANISGDLKNPAKSIPLGTISAIFCTMLTYVLLFVLSAATCTRELLHNNYLYMQYTCLSPSLVEIGISSATISAALTNLIGASRLLNAVAHDRLFGRILDPLTKLAKAGNPLGSVIMTWLVIQLMLFIGSLNKIAQISSILFLYTYFSLNLCCLMCILTSAPNFRPSFKYFNLVTSVIGLVGAAGMTLVINPLLSSFVIIVWMALMVGIHIRSPNVRWGHITQALIFHQVRKYLLLLDQRKEHVKFWRPRILLMVENPRSCLPLMEFVNDLKKSGLFVIGHVQVGSLDEYKVDPIIEQYSIWLRWLDRFTLKAFLEITLAPSVREGLHHIARIAGLGAMKLNTIVFGFYDQAVPIDFLQKTGRAQALAAIESPSSTDAANTSGAADESRDELVEEMFAIRGNGRLPRMEYVAMVSDSMRKLQKSVCLARNYHLLDTSKLGRKDYGQFYIDVWPINFFQSSIVPDNCATLTMQFACILNMVPKWKSSLSIRLMVCSSHENQHSHFARWKELLKELRIEAELIIIIQDLLNFQSKQRNDIDWTKVDPDYVRLINRMLVDQSEQTAVSFMYLPIAPSSPSLYDAYLSNLELLTENMPPTLLVHGNDQVVSTSL